MNQYPAWKYALIAFVIAIGALYALPNLYGEDPALQITSSRGFQLPVELSAEIDNALTDEQLASLAAWYARQPIPAVEVDPDDTVSEATIELVYRGDKTRMIQPCASCHGPRGEGAIIDVPAISGQNVRYFVDTMKDYAREKRANDIYSRMRIIAKALTRDEIEELAVYYARLGNKLAGGGNKQASAD